MKRVKLTITGTAFIGLAIMTIACASSGVSPVPTATALLVPVGATPLPTQPPPPPSATLTPLPTATATSTRTATPEPTPTSVNPKAMALQAFDNALAKLKTYRVVIPQESREIAVQLPDRFLQEGFDSILRIGSTLWIAGPFGIQETQVTSVPFFDRADLYWYRERFAEASQVILLGPGTIEGTPSIGYSASFTTTATLPPQAPGMPPRQIQVAQSIKIWFAVTDGFPRRAELGPPISLTVNFYDWNLDFTIVPP